MCANSCGSFQPLLCGVRVSVAEMRTQAGCDMMVCPLLPLTQLDTLVSLNKNPLGGVGIQTVATASREHKSLKILLYVAVAYLAPGSLSWSMSHGMLVESCECRIVPVAVRWFSDVLVFALYNCLIYV